MKDPDHSSAIAFGRFQANLQTGELLRDGRPCKLPRQSFAILAALLERPGELVTREELRHRLWPEGRLVEFDHSINTAVNRLRHALGDSADGSRVIETLPGRGYRLMVPVRLVPSEPAETVVAAASTKPNRARLLGAALLAVTGITVALLVLDAGGLRHRLFGSATVPQITSICVLPLRNLAAEPGQEYFVEGMHEALLNELSRIGELKLISRTSAMHYRNTDKPLHQIARELGVDGLIEGSVARAGDQVRISVQLIHGPSDTQLWANSYHREFRDILGLQREVADAIARQIEVAVSGQERSRLIAARAVAPDVYEDYLKGRFALNVGSRASLQEALVHFQGAIDRDPTFAPAYAGLAAAHGTLGRVALGTPPGQTRPKAIAAARKALELDPNLADARVVLAHELAREWLWVEAEAEYVRALELNPNSAAAHIGYAHWLLCQGRTREALSWGERGRELDPLALVGATIGWHLFHSRQYDAAIRELQSVLAVEPENPGALWFLGFALNGTGQFDEAIQVLERARSLTDGSSGVLGVLVRAYAGAGRLDEAKQLVEELHRRRESGYVPPAAFLNAYLGLGDREQAFAWLERAAEERSGMTQYVRVHPYLDPLRDDPRFRDLLRRMNFPE